MVRLTKPKIVIAPTPNGQTIFVVIKFPMGKSETIRFEEPYFGQLPAAVKGFGKKLRFSEMQTASLVDRANFAIVKCRSKLQSSRIAKKSFLGSALAMAIGAMPSLN